MKINSLSQLGLRINKSVINQIHLSLKSREDIVAHFEGLFSNELGLSEQIKNRFYLMTRPSLELAGRIKIDEHKFDIRFLSKIAEKKITFLISKNHFFRFMKISDDIFSANIKTTINSEQEEIYSLKMCRIDIAKGCINYSDNPEAPLTDNDFLFFLRLLIFTELSELETIILKPKQKVKKYEKYFNDSENDVIIVDSTWNKILKLKNKISVCGHFKLQAWGQDWADKRLIFIREYKKEGYTRNAKKEITEQKYEGK